jgi:hypothetical protein
MNGLELTQVDRDTLESMIDRHSLAAVLDALTVICHEKAEHLMSAWQDNNAARSWTESAGRIDTVANAAYRKFGR